MARKTIRKPGRPAPKQSKQAKKSLRLADGGGPDWWSKEYWEGAKPAPGAGASDPMQTMNRWLDGEPAARRGLFPKPSRIPSTRPLFPEPSAPPGTYPAAEPGAGNRSLFPKPARVPSTKPLLPKKAPPPKPPNALRQLTPEQLQTAREQVRISQLPEVELDVKEGLKQGQSWARKATGKPMVDAARPIQPEPGVWDGPLKRVAAQDAARTAAQEQFDLRRATQAARAGAAGNWLGTAIPMQMISDQFSRDGGLSGTYERIAQIVKNQRAPTRAQARSDIPAIPGTWTENIDAPPPTQMQRLQDRKNAPIASSPIVGGKKPSADAPRPSAVNVPSQAPTEVPQPPGWTYQNNADTLTARYNQPGQKGEVTFYKGTGNPNARGLVGEANRNIDAGRTGGGTYSELSGPGANGYTPEAWKALSNSEKIAANVRAYNAAGQANNDLALMRQWQALPPNQRRMTPALYEAMHRGATPVETSYNIAMAKLNEAGLDPEQHAAAASRIEQLYEGMRQAQAGTQQDDRRLNIAQQQADQTGGYYRGMVGVQEANSRNAYLRDQAAAAAMFPPFAQPPAGVDPKILEMLPTDQAKNDYVASTKSDYMAQRRAITAGYGEYLKTHPGASLAEYMALVMQQQGDASHVANLGYFANPYLNAPPEGMADGGMVQAPVFGGTPQVQQVDPLVQHYRDYSVKARAAGAPTIPFEQFARILGGAMQQQAPVGMAGGGAVPAAGKMVVDTDPNAPTDSIPAVIDGERPARLDSGEFVIPADVTKYYGTKFFDGLIAKAMQAQDGTTQAAR